MNGAQDLGGRHGFGAVDPEPDEPVFHADWEKRAFALTVAMGFTGSWTIDMARAARESLHPRDYYARSYYAIWLAALEKLMMERRQLSSDEIAAGHALSEPAALPRVPRAANFPGLLSRGSPYERPAAAPAQFAVGDKVRARNLQPKTHTRLPGYARGHVGRIVRVHGCHVFPDRGALSEEVAHWLYSVRFTGPELWGDGAEPDATVTVELWEPYLEPA